MNTYYEMARIDDIDVLKRIVMLDKETFNAAVQDVQTIARIERMHMTPKAPQ